MTNPEQISVNPELVTANLIEMLQQANLLVAQWKAAAQEARHELATLQKKITSDQSDTADNVEPRHRTRPRIVDADTSA